MVKFLSKIYLWLVICCVSKAFCVKSRVKRGLFRDQVVPFLGGKIPESAFYPERLFTNRLNKNGIYSNDGIYFQERHPQRHHFPRKFMPNTIKVHIAEDNSQVASPGQHFQEETIDTTYIVRQTVRDEVNPASVSSKDFPLIPSHSLSLMHFRWGSTSGSDGYDSFQVFKEFAPFLKKLHEYETK